MVKLLSITVEPMECIYVKKLSGLNHWPQFLELIMNEKKVLQRDLA